jgi:hypothetical protein
MGKQLTKITKGGREYLSIQLYMMTFNLKSKKSVYDAVNRGDANKIKIGSASFFSKT